LINGDKVATNARIEDQVIKFAKLKVHKENTLRLGVFAVKKQLIKI